MPEPKDWTEDDLQALIDEGVEESVTLDYKACDAFQKTDEKRREMSKDVSAFANSAGGTIVYGIVQKGQKPVRLDGGYDPRDISKETLERVINTRIHQRIDGVIINPVELRTQHAGHYAYVVCIPQSDRAPHQASDKRYYKRFNFESVAMEEHEVRDVMFRQRVPIVRLSELKIQPVNPSKTGEEWTLNYYLTPVVRNEGRIVAQQFGLEVRVREPLGASWGLDRRGCEPPFTDGVDRVLFQAGTGPLFPSQKQLLLLLSLQLHSKDMVEGRVPPISVILYADNMPPQPLAWQIMEQKAMWDHLMAIDRDLAVRVQEAMHRSSS